MQKNKNIAISILVSFTLIAGLLYVVLDRPTTGEKVGGAQNVEIRDGIQYITVFARGGYSPRVSVAESGIPTKLIMKTNGTYDCSAALLVRDVGFQKILEPTGEEIIDLGILDKNSVMRGSCSMGMYSFQIKAS